MAFSSILQYCIIFYQKLLWHRKNQSREGVYRPENWRSRTFCQVLVLAIKNEYFPFTLWMSMLPIGKICSFIRHLIWTWIGNFEFFNIFCKWTDTVRAKMAKSNGWEYYKIPSRSIRTFLPSSRIRKILAAEFNNTR